MKIGTGDIFNQYNIELKQKKLDLLAEKESYQNTKKYLLDKIAEQEHYIRTFTNIEYKAIADSNRCIAERSLIHIVDLVGTRADTIRRSINVIVQINKELPRIEAEIESVSANIVSEDIFRNVIALFNTKVSDEIVYKGYNFKLGCGLGIVKIKRVLTDKRIKKRINWNESNKKRKELLLQGKTPYQVTERDENRRVVSHNGGEFWFVYFEGDFDFLWHWSKNRNIVFNSGYYRFTPTRYNNETKGGKLGNVNKLAELKKTNSELLKNFY